MKDDIPFLIATLSLIVASVILGAIVGSYARANDIYADCIQQNNHMVVREVETMCARLVGREAE